MLNEEYNERLVNKKTIYSGKKLNKMIPLASKEGIQLEGCKMEASK